jgi:hypothetical protein
MRLSSKILALYCAAQAVIFGSGTQPPWAEINSARIRALWLEWEVVFIGREPGATRMRSKASSGALRARR